MNGRETGFIVAWSQWPFLFFAICWVAGGF